MRGDDRYAPGDVSFRARRAYMARMTSLPTHSAIRTLILATALFMLAAAPASAHHPRRIVPPGNSGASQYAESVPTASGNQPTSSLPGGGGSQGGGGGQGGSGGPGGSAVSSATVHALSAQGAAGTAAATLALATAPSRASSPAGARHRGGPGSGVTATGGQQQVTGASVGAPSAAGSLVKALTGSSSGGLGLLLPVLLAASFLA